MKKFLSLIAALALCLSVYPILALADGSAVVVADPILAAPDWLSPIILWLKAVPAVGPVLVEVLKWIAILTPILTALSVFVQAILAIPEIAARLANKPGVADQIKKVSDSILYWLKYFSNFNVQKQ